MIEPTDIQNSFWLPFISFITCFFTFLAINWLFMDVFKDQWLIIPALAASIASATVTWFYN